MQSKKGKEKEKEQSEDSGVTRYGTTSPESGPSSPHHNGDAMGGQDVRQNGKPTRGSLKRGKAKYVPKNGQNAGGARGAASARVLSDELADLSAREKGARDALREIGQEKVTAEKAVMTLTRELQEATVELRDFENRMNATHHKWAGVFQAGWEEEAPRSWIYLWALLPALIVWAAILFASHNWADDLEWVIVNDDSRVQLAIWCMVAYFFLARHWGNKYLSSRGLANMVSIRGMAYVLRFFTNVRAPRIKHQYKMIELTNYHHPDMRADVMAMGDLKHADAIYGLVEYTVRLNGVLINKDAWGQLTGQPGQMLISMELLAQLCTPTCMQSSDQSVTQLRLESFAKSIHSVNVDRYLSWRIHDVVGNTVTTALGVWKQRLEQRVGYFPATLA